MDEGRQTRGRALHARATEGEALTAAEREELNAYYAAVEGSFPKSLDTRLETMEARNQNLEALVARSEAFAAYLQTVLATADTERQALEREFQRLAA